MTVTVWALLIAPAHAESSAVVEGPWRSGRYVTLAAEGKRVHAAWIEGDDDSLMYAFSRNRGKRWSRAELISDQVMAGDGGQIRPEVLVVQGEPVVGYIKNDALWLGSLEGGSWSHRRLRQDAPGMGVLFDITATADGVSAVWLDTRRDPATHLSDVYAWHGGTEELVYVDGADGVCMCCRPAVARDEQGGLVVSFRDADGELREIRTLRRMEDGWVTVGLTDGGWAPGGCPADGPVLSAGTTPLFSDARSGARAIYSGDDVLKVGDGAELLQPRSVGTGLVWIAATSGRQTLMMGDLQVSDVQGRLELGDPVVVGRSVWIPWQGQSATVVQVRLP